MVLPTRQRQRALERGEGRIVVTVDRDQCLLIYPLPDWEQIERKLMSLPSLNERARRLQRLMVGHATEIELDAQGLKSEETASDLSAELDALSL
jgi:MraZ protein